jgi:DNA-binding transcriptional LysR family regulator
MFDWDDLRYFLAVAREGSTIAAADALKVNQSTVQRRLAALEDELERKLVERFPTGYCLTATGLALRPHAEAVEAAIAAFERELSAADRELSGTIRVTGAEGLVYLILTPLVETFRSAHPGVAVEVITTERKLDLARGEADVAFRTGVLESSDLVGRKVADLAWAVYATRGYVERHGRPAHPREIENHAVIRFEGALSEIHADRWLRSVAPGARVAARSGGVPGMLLMVRSGVGLAALPAHIGDSEADLVRVIDPVPELMSPIHLLAHPDLHKTARVRAFFDFVIREIGSLRPLLLGKTACD